MYFSACTSFMYLIFGATILHVMHRILGDITLYIVLISIIQTCLDLFHIVWSTKMYLFHTRISAWWHHQMEAFSVLLALCAGNSPVTGEFRLQRPVAPSFDVFFDPCLNKRLSKQSWGWWFVSPSRSLSRHCNGVLYFDIGDWICLFASTTGL